MHVLRVAISPVRFSTVVALVLIATMAVTSLSIAPAGASAESGAEARLAALVNVERRARGLPALATCADLGAVARRWSGRMAADGRLSHNPNLGRQVGGWHAVGEIVGYSTTVDDVHRHFMNSPMHRAKIVSSTYTQIGVGLAHGGGRIWVTEVFRQPDGSVPCVPVSADITTACPPAAVPPAGFTDTARNTHRAAIDCGAWYGLVQGTSADRYSPTQDVDRAQMATFLTRLVSQTSARLPPPRDQGFTDIAGSYHADAINRLAGAGIVQGTSASTYAPSVTVNRAQMASFLVRAYEFASGEGLAAGEDRFGDDTGSVHEPAINKAAGAGFLAGTSATTSAPTQAVRRDQLASFLARTLNRLVERGQATPPV